MVHDACYKLLLGYKELAQSQKGLLVLSFGTPFEVYWRNVTNGLPLLCCLLLFAGASGFVNGKKGMTYLTVLRPVNVHMAKNDPSLFVHTFTVSLFCLQLHNFAENERQLKSKTKQNLELSAKNKELTQSLKQLHQSYIAANQVRHVSNYNLCLLAY